MKKIMIAFLMVATMMSCADETTTNNMTEATILGRWVPEGFESNVRYLFTEDKRYTVYGTGDGTFPTDAEVIADNPVTLTDDYWFEGDVLVIDLNFGNFSRLTPVFTCDNEVVKWMEEDGTIRDGAYYREGHDIAECE